VIVEANKKPIQLIISMPECLAFLEEEDLSGDNEEAKRRQQMAEYC
jgi:hypothetical protein